MNGEDLLLHISIRHAEGVICSTENQPAANAAPTQPLPSSITAPCTTSKKRIDKSAESFTYISYGSTNPSSFSNSLALTICTFTEQILLPEVWLPLTMRESACAADSHRQGRGYRAKGQLGLDAESVEGFLGNFSRMCGLLLGSAEVQLWFRRVTAHAIRCVR